MPSVQKIDGFTEKPERNTPALVNQEKGSNRHIPSCIIAVMLHCSRQGIAIRDDCEGVTDGANTGNFLAMLKLMAKRF